MPIKNPPQNQVLAFGLRVIIQTNPIINKAQAKLATKS